MLIWSMTAESVTIVCICEECFRGEKGANGQDQVTFQLCIRQGERYSERTEADASLSPFNGYTVISQERQNYSQENSKHVGVSRKYYEDQNICLQIVYQACLAGFCGCKWPLFEQKQNTTGLSYNFWKMD